MDAAEIVRRHGAMVWATVYRIVGREEDAKDCFQDAFVAAFDRAQREKVRSWEGLLKRIATTKALDTLRRRIRRRTREIWDGDTQLAELAADSQGSAGADPPMEVRELIERLRDALIDLPPDQAEAFCMRHVSDMSYEEIGEVRGMTANAVGVMLHRTRQRLVEMMNVNTPKTRGEVMP